ncbi:MAG: hypothetical protein RR513_06585 [Muribaculaceae bacterium]
MATTPVITQLDPIEDYFLVGNEIIIFDAPLAGYTATTTLADFKNPMSIGNIEDGSFAEEGEDATFEDWKNIEGGSVTSTPTEGSNGFSFNHMSFTPERIKKMMGGSALTDTAATATFVKVGSKVTGFGGKKGTIIVCPIAILDRERKRWMLYPKGRIATSLTASGNRYIMKSTVKADFIETPNLETVMYIQGDAVYSTGV